MFEKINNKQLGHADHGWLKTIHHFSFANYYDPSNMNFGVLRVLNDDLIKAHRGFGTHPHSDMEIITYVINGNLTHADSMGNKHEIGRGDIQYMSAGTGVYHSEHNMGRDLLRLIQLWIIPDKEGHTPNYGDLISDWEEREGKWYHMVSPVEGSAPIKIHQDANIYSLALNENEEITFEVKKDRQAYLVLLEGNAIVNGELLEASDAAKIIEEDIKIKSKDFSHYLVVEMKK
ncbi:pirin family protein [Gottfriedia acidiceleris]|uniref:pirin family protein n=1 Tax=Gottfriedia acidiceleris TaxID=371036 RepID=UPI002FFEAF26